jgi:hypothetical protein
MKLIKQHEAPQGGGGVNAKDNAYPSIDANVFLKCSQPIAPSLLAYRR